MRLVKNVVFVIVLIYVLLLWRQHASTFKVPAKAPRHVVITFSTAEELIEKLRQVKTGQSIELQAGPQAPAEMAPGIRCSDEAAKAAWMEQEDQLHKEQNQIIKAELKRIHDGAPDSPVITWQ